MRIAIGDSRRRAWHLGVLALCALSCAAAPDGRRQIREALQREVEPLPPVVVASPDRRVQLEVEAHGEVFLEPVGDGGSLYSLEVPIAEDSVIHCLIFPSGYQLGTLLAKLVEDEPTPPVKERRILATEAGMMGDRPFVLVEYGGVVPHEQKERLFMIRAAGVSLGLSSVLCVHEGVGYSATFRRVVGGIAASVRVADGGVARAPDAHVVYATKPGDEMTGFSESRFYRNEDDSWATVRRSTVVVQRAEDELAGTDTIEIRRSDAAGRIIGEFAGRVGGDDRGWELELESAKRGSYQVSGLFRGRTADANFTPTMPLADDRRMLEAIREAIGAVRPAVTIEQWLPEVAPTGSTALTIRCTGAADGNQRLCEITGAAVPITLLVEPTGAIAQITAPFDGAELVESRIHAYGELFPHADEKD